MPLAKDLFVPITIVAYLYLSLTYGGYPYLVRLLVPKHLRGIQVQTSKTHNITPQEKLTFSVIACTVLCLLFPVAAPLFLSFFIGIAIRESGLNKYAKLIEETFLYGATFFLGLMLGVLCEASTILNPKIFILLVLGICNHNTINLKSLSSAVYSGRQVFIYTIIYTPPTL